MWPVVSFILCNMASLVSCLQFWQEKLKCINLFMDCNILVWPRFGLLWKNPKGETFGYWAICQYSREYFRFVHVIWYLVIPDNLQDGDLKICVCSNSNLQPIWELYYIPLWQGRTDANFVHLRFLNVQLLSHRFSQTVFMDFQF